jgi:Spy/CpxP family protein refolding chaperone
MNRTGYKKAMVFVMVVMFLGGQALAGGGGRGRMRGHGFGPGAYGAPNEDSFCSPMACGMGPMAGRHHGPGIARALRRLDLTEEQKESVKNILESARETAAAGRETVADAREALHTAVAEGADETAIREAAENLGKAIGDQAVSRAAVVASIKEILTEEQIEQLQEMKDSKPRGGLEGEEIGPRGFHRGNRHDMFGRGPGRPGRGPGRRAMRDVRRGMRGRGVGPRAGARLDWFIEQADTDNNGTLTAEELEAFRKKAEGLSD